MYPVYAVLKFQKTVHDTLAFACCYSTAGHLWLKDVSQLEGNRCKVSKRVKKADKITFVLFFDLALNSDTAV